MTPGKISTRTVPPKESPAGPSARIAAVACCTLLALSWAVPVATAGVTGGAGSCAQEAAGINLNCTAEDVRISSFEVIELVDGCTSTSDTATVRLVASLEVNAARRYDLGFFLALDGGTAVTGQCFREYLPPPLSGSATNADIATGYGPYLTADPDTCGDGAQNDVTVDPIVRILSEETSSSAPQAITLPCSDLNENGYLDVAYCTAWRNSGQGFDCSSIYEAGVAQTAAKCKCDRVDIDVRVDSPAAPPVLELVKTVMPATGTCGVDDIDSLTVDVGEQVKYCFTVTNTSQTDAWDLHLVDDMGTPADPSDDQTIVLAPLSALGGTAAGDLDAGASASGTSAAFTVQSPGTVLNTATVTGSNPNGGDPVTDEDQASVGGVALDGICNMATATGKDSATNADVLNTGSVCVKTHLQDPAIHLVKTVMPAGGTCGVDDVDSLEVTVGASVRYCYSVTPEGNPATHQPALDVVLVDDMGTPADPGDDQTIVLDGLTELGGDPGLGDLAPGATATGRSGVVTISTETTIVNMATVTASDPDPGDSLLEDTDPAEVTASLRDSSLTVFKSVMLDGGTCGLDDVPSLTVPAGTDVRYCYAVTADGTPETYAPVYDVTLVDDLATPADPADDVDISLSPLFALGGDGSIGDLPAGSTAFGESAFPYTATGTTPIVNTATAAGRNPDGDPLEDDATAEVTPTATTTTTTTTTITIPPPATADLSIAKTGPAGSVEQGSFVTYELTVTNDGPDAATNVHVMDNLDANTIFFASSRPCTEAPAGVLDCDLGDIANGDSVKFTVTVHVVPAAPTVGAGSGTPCLGTEDLCNTAAVSSDTTDPDPADDTTDVATDVIAAASVATLSLTKTDVTAEPVAPGANVTYEITVSNAGPATATDVVVHETLDPFMTYVSDTATGGCTVTDPGDGVTTGASLDCPLGDIAATGASSFQITVTLSMSAPASSSLQVGDCTGSEDVCNEAAVSTSSSDAVITDNTDSEPTNVAVPVGCGNGILEVGEACDPPSAEICDNGIDDDGDLALDCADTDCAIPEFQSCDAACQLTTPCLPILRDPARVTSKMVFIHGQFLPTTEANPQTDGFVFSLSNEFGEIWRGILQPGDFVSKRGRNKPGRWRFKDYGSRRGNGMRGGVFRVGIHQRKNRTGGPTIYVFTLRAYADFSAATVPTMTTQVRIGNDMAFLTAAWAGKPGNWHLRLSQLYATK